ncbi:MAG: hypothetical protein EPO42_14700 [Gallionellaceae bacterium]|nr:MAG: hypothetical protein EPO42_14700 [Gallionellaceae bacterium]
MLTRVIVDLIDDTGGRQLASFHLYGTVSTALDRQPDSRERFQDYGFTSHPRTDAPDRLEGIVAFLGGNRDHGILICVEDRRYRLKGLKSGEAALYDDQDQVVHLKRNEILVKSPLKVRVEADVVEVVAHTTLRHDVHGYADELTWTGGNDWTQTNWHDGANVTVVNNPIDPPLHFHDVDPEPADGP